MKIVPEGGLYGAGASGAQATRRVDSRIENPGLSGGTEAPLDRIELSATAALLSRILDVADSMRASEIAALAEAHAAGKLNVDSMALSKALIADAIDARQFSEVG
jgi:anti-sigma28 factor (negative regulator of flagellin synthesis)